ncbi:MAG TPA: replication-associated recombination protein A [Actinomycetota bacterium]|nr:replication-associated recombination protein A [Actinomycetota bacterium]
MDRPLATRMRPRNFKEFVGHQHLLGEGKPLTKLIDGGHLPSIILWGPPGTGKTTLAHLLATAVGADFQQLSAVSSGVSDARRVMDHSKTTLLRTVLFVDEVHRWNKAQQEILLPAIEDGSITLIGATTENPYHSLVSPLLSRCLMLRLEPLEPKEIRGLLEVAVVDAERGMGALGVTLTDDALDHLVELSAGDARVALTALEAAVLLADAGETLIDGARVADAVQKRIVAYDRGDNHFDVVSAFIKSMRGSDPDAALFWLSRMIQAGEDPRFIVRRMVIFASEDVGLADPQALPIAVAAAHALEQVGLPEARFNLAEAVLYLARAPKSNSVMGALEKAMADADSADPVPPHLRDAHYAGAAKLGHGEGYEYPHDFEGHHVEQQYRPVRYDDARYYEPSGQGRDIEVEPGTGAPAGESPDEE